jgi:hypothetical protein
MKKPIAARMANNSEPMYANTSTKGWFRENASDFSGLSKSRKIHVLTLGAKLAKSVSGKRTENGSMKR